MSFMRYLVYCERDRSQTQLALGRIADVDTYSGASAGGGT